MAETDPDVIRARTTAEQLAQQFQAPKRAPGRPKAVQSVTKSAPEITDAVLWREAMICVMGCFAAKTPSQVRSCAAAAEEYIVMFKERFK